LIRGRHQLTSEGRSEHDGFFVLSGFLRLRLQLGLMFSCLSLQQRSFSRSLAIELDLIGMRQHEVAETNPQLPSYEG
jgi:hypothetical protein